MKQKDSRLPMMIIGIILLVVGIEFDITSIGIIGFCVAGLPFLSLMCEF